jgi:hypothetical protein
MPEVKASPATPDKSLSHSRYSLATHRDLENFRLGVHPSGPALSACAYGVFPSSKTR